MNNGLRLWLRGLLAALITGGSSGVTSALGANLVAPETFTLADGVGKTLALAGMVAGVSAVNGVAAYLKQSPLPPAEGA